MLKNTSEEEKVTIGDQFWIDNVREGKKHYAGVLPVLNDYFKKKINSEEISFAVSCKIKIEKTNEEFNGVLIRTENREYIYVVKNKTTYLKVLFSFKLKSILSTEGPYFNKKHILRVEFSDKKQNDLFENNIPAFVLPQNDVDLLNYFLEKDKQFLFKKEEAKNKKKGLEHFEGKWVKKDEIPKLRELKFGLDNNFKDMNPFEFENFVGKLFTAMGYETQVTKKTGDYGVDVIAKKGNDVLAIQVKKYDKGNPVGNREVQMLLGAMQKKGIRANHSLLITTSHFTVQAREQAKECAIELWDGQELKKMVRKYLMKIE